MKYFYLFISIILTSFLNNTIGNPISGKLVDHDGNGLGNVEVYIYLQNVVESTLTNEEGNFVFNNITSVEDEELPKGYVVSENYPNPFNPKTRFSLSVPEYSQVNISIYNVLGQRLAPTIMKEYNAGQHYVDLELTGLPNGTYLARFNFNGKHTLIRKMMLLYGNQHLHSASPVSFLPKDNKNQINNAQIDSLVVTSKIIGRHSFTNLPSYSGSTLYLGEFTINRFCEDTPTIEYAGKIYNTIKIGERCWLKENLNYEVTINSWCYDNDSSNCEKYGRLYSWSAAMNGSTTSGAQGICPEGWHIPTIEEFRELINYANNQVAALIDESETLSYTPTVTQNETGFSALFAGHRYNNNNDCDGLEYYTFFWSSTPSTQYHYDGLVNSVGMYFDDSNATWIKNYKALGLSVRCIKD